MEPTYGKIFQTDVPSVSLKPSSAKKHSKPVMPVIVSQGDSSTVSVQRSTSPTKHPTLSPKSIEAYETTSPSVSVKPSSKPAQTLASFSPTGSPKPLLI
jgi:hypothetical protein